MAENRGEMVFVRHLPSRYVVELHRDYITGGSLRRYVYCDLEPVLSRRESISIENIPVPVPSLGDQVVGACVHAAYGHQWHSMLHFYDLAMMAKRSSQRTVSDVIEEASRLKVTNAVMLSLWRTSEFFPSTRSTLLMQENRPGYLLRFITNRIVPKSITLRPWSGGNRFRRIVFREMFKRRLL
jgi:hypothetical protein